jgi:hypothetical protein
MYLQISSYLKISLVAQPCGPKQLFTMFATSLAALMLFCYASLPLVSFAPSLKLKLEFVDLVYFVLTKLPPYFSYYKEKYNFISLLALLIFG